MASIQRRGENSFLLVVELGYDGSGKRLRRTKTIRVEDEKLLRTKKRLQDHLDHELHKFKIKVESGEFIAPSKTLYSDFIKLWDDKFAQYTRNLAKTTRKNYLTNLKNYVIPEFGNKKMDEIKTIHIVNFLHELSLPGSAKSERKEPLADSSIYEIDKVMRVIFNKAVEWRVINESPMNGLSRPKVTRKSMEYYEEQDVFDFIEALFKEHIVWRMYFLTSSISGMRRGEVGALQWPDFNFERDCIELTRSIPLFIDGNPYIKGTKTNEEKRVIYMPSWYMDLMKDYKEFWESEKYAAGDKWLGGDDQYLFHNGFGRPYTPNSATSMWNKIKDRHDLKDIRLHDLRHTMITYLLNEGESVFNVSKRAGHSSSKVTTDIYGHPTERGGKSTAKHFEKFNPEHLVNNRSTEPVFIDKA